MNGKLEAQIYEEGVLILGATPSSTYCERRCIRTLTFASCRVKSQPRAEATCFISSGTAHTYKHTCSRRSHCMSPGPTRTPCNAFGSGHNATLWLMHICAILGSRGYRNRCIAPDDIKEQYVQRSYYNHNRAPNQYHPRL